MAESLKRAEEELAKENGMNPEAVLSALKTLNSVWEVVGTSTGLQTRVSNVRDTVLRRMQVSMDEAAKAGQRKKAHVLVAFGAKYDEALSGLGVNSSISQELASSLLRVATGTGAGPEDDFLSDEWRNVPDFMSTDAIQRCFRKWDSEGTGKVAKTDFMKVVKALDDSLPEDMVDSLFSVADANRDGFIDYEEFLVWLSR